LLRLRLNDDFQPAGASSGKPSVSRPKGVPWTVEACDVSRAGVSSSLYTVSNLFEPFFVLFLRSRMLFFRNKKMTKIPWLGKSYSPPLVDRLFSHDSQPAGRWTSFVSVCRGRMKERWATAVVSSSQPHRWPQFFRFGCYSHQLLSHSSWSQESKTIWRLVRLFACKTIKESDKLHTVPLMKIKQLERDERHFVVHWHDAAVL
jgi:hypothetical protein